MGEKGLIRMVKNNGYILCVGTVPSCVKAGLSVVSNCGTRMLMLVDIWMLDIG